MFVQKVLFSEGQTESTFDEGRLNLSEVLLCSFPLRALFNHNLENQLNLEALSR